MPSFLEDMRSADVQHGEANLCSGDLQCFHGFLIDNVSIQIINIYGLKVSFQPAVK